MKTISRFFCGALLAASVYACKKGNDATPQLTVDRTDISLGTFEGFTDSFEVQSSTPWELQLSPASIAELVELSTTSGNAGKTIVKLTTIGTSFYTQNGTITVNPSGRETPSIEVALTQRIYEQDWKKIIGSTTIDAVNAVASTSDGGWVIAGSTLSDGSGNIPATNGYHDGLVAKLNAAGNIEWIKTFGGIDGDYFSSIVVTPDGGFLACGTTVSSSGDVPPSKGQFDGWAVKLKADGTKEWAKRYGGDQVDRIHSVCAAPGGGYILAGETTSENNGDIGENNGAVDVWVAKLSPGGEIVWSKAFGGDNYDKGMDVAVSAEGKIAVLAATSSNNSGQVGDAYGDGDAWLLNLDANGNINWSKAFGGSSFDEMHCIAATSDNGFVMAGYTTSINSGDVDENKGETDTWILKVDATGNKLWSRTYGGDSYDNISDVAVNAEGELLLTGNTFSNNNGDLGPIYGGADYWLLKLNSAGSKLWSKTMGGNLADDCIAVSLNSNGEFVAAGITHSNNNGDVDATFGDKDIWLVKFK